MIPTWMQYLGYAIFAFLAVYALVSVWRLVTGRIRGFYPAALQLVRMAYPLGFACKVTIIGPEFVRWHLTDLGFTAAVGYMLYLKFEDRTPWSPSDKVSQLRFVTLSNLRMRTTMLAVAWVLSVLYELFTMWVYSRKPGAKPFLIGNFDWMDVLMYTVGALVSLVLVHFWRRDIIAALDVMETKEAEDAEQVKRDARALRAEQRRERGKPSGTQRASYKRKPPTGK